MSRTGRRRPGPGSRAAAAGHTRVTEDMTVMIHRLVVGYAVFGMAPGLRMLVQQAPLVAPTWLVFTCGGYLVVVVGMIVRGVRARPLGAWAAAFAALTLVAVVWLPTAVPGRAMPTQPWIYWVVGLAIVCAGVWGGRRATISYGVVLGIAWTVLRVSPGGGAQSWGNALSESVFAVSAGWVITVVALGMLSSAAASDEVAERLYARQLQEAVDHAVAEERARLDQLMHDDVMTTLTSAAYAGDAETGEATALLSRETLVKLDALPATGGREGSISLAVFGTIADQTARRVSPDVGYVEQVGSELAVLRLPVAVAEAALGALREAVRNAVRHARADEVRVEVLVGGRAEALRLEVRVLDDGRGFVPEDVPPNRFGVRVSMLGADQPGLTTELVSRPGHGTRFTLRWVGAPGPARRRRRVATASSEAGLPVAFPVGQFTLVTWLAVGVGIGVGFANLDLIRSVPLLLLAMLAVVVGTALLLRPTRSLRLDWPAAVGALVCLAASMVLMNLTLTMKTWPDMGLWHAFPTQLMLTTLVIRRRVGYAVVGLVVVEACTTWWSLSNGLGWDGVLRAGSGHLLFVVMAVLVNRVLRTIARRQARLRQQEDAAIDESVRRHVALVQRSLWVADLKDQARAILVRLATVTGPVPPAMRYDALLVEATLRESLVARNVMSDELAVLTENARRRGVDVRFVDSRHSVVPVGVNQGLLDAVRRALASESVTRLVVRLAPDDGASKATVLAEDATGTHLVTLDRDGVGEAREVWTRES